MEVQKKILIISLFFLLFGNENYSQMRKIHVIKIIDSDNSNYTIQKSALFVSNKIDNEIRVIASSIDIFPEDILTYNVMGKKFTRKNLEKVLDYDLEYSYKDIIFMIYYGHGKRTKYNNTYLPEIKFLDTPNETQFFNIQNIIDKIIFRRPSYLISIIIACNKETTNEDNGILISDLDTENISTYLESDYMLKYASMYELFKNENETISIILNSSKKGEQTKINLNGGVFFNTIFEVLNDETSKDYLTSWDKILFRIKNLTKIKAEPPYSEHPVCKIEHVLDPAIIKKGVFKKIFWSRRDDRIRMKKLKIKQRIELKNLRRVQQAERKKAKRFKRKIRRNIAIKQREALKSLKKRHHYDKKKLKEFLKNS